MDLKKILESEDFKKSVAIIALLTPEQKALFVSKAFALAIARMSKARSDDPLEQSKE